MNRGLCAINVSVGTLSATIASDLVPMASNDYLPLSRSPHWRMTRLLMQQPTSAPKLVWACMYLPQLYRDESVNEVQLVSRITASRICCSIFERTGYSTVSSPIGQRILHEKILRMLMGHSFLMHTVIAFSSSHLAYLSRDKPYYTDTVLTASYHTQRALHLYTHHINLHQRDHSYSRMDDPSALEEMDALFAASFLLKSLFFHVDEAYLPRKSWTITSTPVAHFGDQCDDWIGNTSGLNVVFSLKQFRAKLGQSIWRPFLEEVNRLNGHPSKEMNRLPNTSPSPRQLNLHNNFSPPSSTNTPTSKVSSGIPTTTIHPQTIHDTYPYPSTTNTLPNIPPPPPPPRPLFSQSPHLRSRPHPSRPHPRS